VVRGEYPTYSVVDNGPNTDDEVDNKENNYEAYPVKWSSKQTTEAHKEITQGPAKARFDGPNMTEHLKT